MYKEYAEGVLKPTGSKYDRGSGGNSNVTKVEKRIRRPGGGDETEKKKSKRRENEIAFWNEFVCVCVRVRFTCAWVLFIQRTRTSTAAVASTRYTLKQHNWLRVLQQASDVTMTSCVRVNG